MFFSACRRLFLILTALVVPLALSGCIESTHDISETIKTLRSLAEGNYLFSSTENPDETRLIKIDYISDTYRIALSDAKTDEELEDVRFRLFRLPGTARLVIQMRGKERGDLRSYVYSFADVKDGSLQIYTDSNVIKEALTIDEPKRLIEILQSAVDSPETPLIAIIKPI